MTRCERVLMLGMLLVVPTMGSAQALEGARPSDVIAAAPQGAPARLSDLAPASPAPGTTAAVASDAPPLAAERRGFRTLFRDLGGDFAHLASWQTVAVAGIGGAAALAVHPADQTTNARLESSSFLGPGNWMGNTFTMMGASFATYGVGLATGSPRVTHVALDVVRAETLAEVITQTLKHTVRRERPDGSNNLSFPSGHAAVTFAAATVLERHHGLAWALPAYGLAAYVSASRLHDNVHYLSDVVFGAAVGTIAGRTVTRHGASTFVVVPELVPGGAGVFVAHSLGR